MKELLLDMKAEVERAKALSQHELDVLVLARLLRRYDELLARSATRPILLLQPQAV